jgi:hypothetical protein
MFIPIHAWLDWSLCTVPDKTRLTASKTAPPGIDAVFAFWKLRLLDLATLKTAPPGIASGHGSRPESGLVADTSIQFFSM